MPEGEAAKYMLRRDGCAGQVAFLVYDSVRPAPSHPVACTSWPQTLSQGRAYAQPHQLVTIAMLTVAFYGGWVSMWL